MGVVFNPRCDVSIAHLKDGELLGGVIYNNATDNSIQVHVAGFRHGWLTREFMRVVFSYPYLQLSLPVVFAQIRASNRRALEFNLKIGFKEVCRLPDIYRDDVCVLTSMSKAECRWIGPHDGEEAART